MEKNKEFKTLAVLVAIIAMIVLSVFAYAKFISSANGSATAQIANMVCDMNVVCSEQSNTIINPYCTVTLKNYKFNNETSQNVVTQTDVKYTVDVVIEEKEGVEKPKYYWKDAGGNIIKRNASLEGRFLGNIEVQGGKNITTYSEETQVYTIVFENTGEMDLERDVEFELKAVQDVQ